jgi:hypothetical protein
VIEETVVPSTKQLDFTIDYGRRVLCNAPYRGAALREFHEVAQLAGQAVRGQNRFERIYLLNALEPGLQAFEIFPARAECR